MPIKGQVRRRDCDQLAFETAQGDDLADMTEVAIIGAGPAGLAAARYLASEGFEPILFEQGAAIGGQWSGDRAHSGVWPSMRTNTSRILTAFSDLPKSGCKFSP